MTGVNFAIAETGTFLVCTNEGNADIGAAVPPLHIASIGIEKLIPRVEDMGVFLRLLTRSALGEHLTQYSSHFTGPRKGGELHTVLVDNGRSRRLGMTEFWHSLKCTCCGLHGYPRPVYRRSGGLSYGATYSGLIGVILDPTFDEFKYSELPFHSTLCGSCSEVCPVKIDISDQILKWRRVLVTASTSPLAKRLPRGCRACLRSSGRISCGRKGSRAGAGSHASLPPIQPVSQSLGAGSGTAGGLEAELS